MKDQLITAKQVCEILCISLPTLYRWEAEGRLPFPKLKIGPAAVRFRKSDVIAHIEQSDQSENEAA